MRCERGRGSRHRARQGKQYFSRLWLLGLGTVLLCCVWSLWVSLSQVQAVDRFSDGGASSQAAVPAADLPLINFQNPLPEGLDPDLVPIDGSGQQMERKAAQALEEMLAAMRDQGLSPLVCSAYRTQEEQAALFESQVQGWLSQGLALEEAQKEASLLVARPGTSEHQTGLAADIVSQDHQVLDESQESTPEQQWLLAHCQEYGFILRYPAGKTDLTGVSYEPWHYRYVGKEYAGEIMARGLCLEEFLAGAFEA